MSDRKERGGFGCNCGSLPLGRLRYWNVFKVWGIMMQEFKDRVKLGMSPSATVTDIWASSKDTDRVAWACCECGSYDVEVKSTSSWSIQEQAWVHAEVDGYYEAYCGMCEKWTDSQEVWYPDNPKHNSLSNIHYDGDKIEPKVTL